MISETVRPGPARRLGLAERIPANMPQRPAPVERIEAGMTLSTGTMALAHGNAFPSRRNFSSFAHSRLRLLPRNYLIFLCIRESQKAALFLHSSAAGKVIAPCDPLSLCPGKESSLSERLLPAGFEQNLEGEDP